MTDRASPSGQFEKHKDGKRDRRVETVDRQVRALQLRKSGLSYDAIAETLGFANRSGPHKAVHKALRETVREEATALRALELSRLDRLQLAAWPAATANPPDLEATRTVLKIMTARARLLGLNAPTEVKGELLFKQMAQRVADEEGIDVDMLIAEAQRILDDARGA
jgi:hypothetical protein